MNDFIASLPKKIDKFIEILIDYNGYVKVLQGLQNTLKIAVLGLIIGIVIGTLIATVRVIPKYKVLPRILNAICAFYVALFRGTPMVVQLLIFYYVVLPIMGVNLPSVSVAIAVFGLNSGAYISEIMRSGIQSVDDGQMEGGRSVGLSFSTTMMRIVIPQAIKNILPTLATSSSLLSRRLRSSRSSAHSTSMSRSATSARTAMSSWCRISPWRSSISS